MFAHVPGSNPDHTWSVGLEAVQRDEVRVLADDDRLLHFGKAPHLMIWSPAQPYLIGVLSLVTLRTQELGESGWELIIYDESQASLRGAL